MVIGIILGVFLGGFIGVVIMAILSAAKEDRYTKFLLSENARLNDLIKDLTIELRKKRNELRSYKRRLEHLLKSSFIKKYDEKIPFSNKYVRDINEVDQIAAKGKQELKERED